MPRHLIFSVLVLLILTQGAIFAQQGNPIAGTALPPGAPVVLPATAVPATPSTAGAVATLPAANLPLQPGDTVTVTVAGEPAISGTYSVREDGRIIFPVAGTVQVSGQTSTQLADTLAAALRTYVVNPVVSVTVVTATPRMVTILGDVARPGSYDLRQAPTLQALMALAGGVTATGDLVASTLVRRGQVMRLAPEGKLQSGDMRLEVGDVVSVPSTGIGSAHITGAVKTPAALPLTSCNSAAKALLLCGGPTPDGDLAAAYILRGGKRMPLDLSTYGDMALLPGDVLMVPQKTESSCYVLGEVKTPGPQVLIKPLRVSSALAHAGGLVPTADGSRSYILRGEERVPVNLASLLQEGEGQQDVPLSAGDVLVVPKNTALVHVTGQVVRPGPLPLISADSVLTAWAQAGGPTPDADLSNAMLLRNNETLPLDLKALERGDRRQDLKLIAGDRIMVPKLAKTVYVLGQVVRPGIYSIGAGDTLIDVIARAGGPTATAAHNSIAVVRKTPAQCAPPVETPRRRVCKPQEEEIPADKLQQAIQCGLSIRFVDMAKGAACDQEGAVAQAGDLIYIPAIQPKKIDWLTVLLTIGTALLVD
ncbi:MAG: polysaccharide biosynthesis/export family protein [Armatimonadota bacterium]